MKPLHAEKFRLSRCRCCHSKYWKGTRRQRKNRRNTGRGVAKRAFRMHVEKEMGE